MWSIIWDDTIGSTDFLGSGKHCTFPRKYYSSKPFYITFCPMGCIWGIWIILTKMSQDVGLFQLRTPWHEHLCIPAVSKLLTFCLDPQGCPDQGKEGGIEHDSPIAVQGHVHGDKALWGEEKRDNNHTATPGLKHALSSWPATPLMWISMACGLVAQWECPVIGISPNLEVGVWLHEQMFVLGSCI